MTTAEERERLRARMLEQLNELEQVIREWQPQSRGARHKVASLLRRIDRRRAALIGPAYVRRWEKE